MSTITRDIIEELHDDLISHGWLVQAIMLVNDVDRASDTTVRNVLRELLETEQVDVGLTRQTKPDYLEFVGWKGTVDERVERAMDAVAIAIGSVKGFAYWLCLRENVDRYEDNPK